MLWRSQKGLQSFEALCDRWHSGLEKGALGLGAVFILLFWIFIRATAADPDLFARLAQGRLIFENGAVPLTDPFAYTPKKPFWVDHEWLAGYVFYAVYLCGGDFLLFLFKCVFALCAVTILYRAAGLYRGEAAGFWLTLIMAFSCAYVWNSTVRSQVFTYLFLPVYLYAFVVYQKHGRLREIFFLPAVMLVWANAHGGFVVGLGLFFIFWTGSAVLARRVHWPLLLSFVLCLCATCITPYGVILFWGFIYEAISMSRPSITEWVPLNPFSAAAVIPCLWTLVLLAGIWRKRQCLDCVGLALTAVSLYFGFRHLRLIAIYMMVSYVYGQPYLAAVAAAFTHRSARFVGVLRRSAALVAVCGSVVLGALCLKDFKFSGFSLDYSQYPVEALTWLAKERRGGGKLLVDFNNGSYALWRLYPNFLISVDGRYEEVYPDQTLAAVNAALNPSSAHHETSLKVVWPDFILLGDNLTAFHNPESFGPKWQVAYRDPKFLVLE